MLCGCNTHACSVFYVALYVCQFAGVHNVIQSYEAKGWNKSAVAGDGRELCLCPYTLDMG